MLGKPIDGTNESIKADDTPNPVEIIQGLIPGGNFSSGVMVLGTHQTLLMPMPKMQIPMNGLGNNSQIGQIIQGILQG